MEHFIVLRGGELTKLVDTNKDGKADVIETIYAWPVSGHYHEYSFGPKIAPDGSFFVTTNVAFGVSEWWRGESFVPWRGWTLKITEDGKMQPWATGMRSPAGLGMIDGELFYTDNQGDWMPSGAIWHVTKGAFFGHPAGLRWTEEPASPLKLKTEDIYAKVDPRFKKDEHGNDIKPENVVNEEFVTPIQMKEYFKEFKLPAVWLPHAILGVSNSEIIKIPEGHFGPFEGQLLVGDQGQSKIMRVVMEKVDGEYQGVAFDFRSGFQSGVLRMDWGKDGSLFVGMTNRGWGSAGYENQGLQRLIWNNNIPFEMRSVKAMPDGFEIEFTMPVNVRSAEDLASYAVESFTYKYHPVYGSPMVNYETHKIKGVKVSSDAMRVRLVVDNPRRYHIHKISLNGVRAQKNSWSLIHPDAYYTLNNIPKGQALSMSEVSTFNSAEEKQVKSNSSSKSSAVAKTTANTAGTAEKTKEEPVALKAPSAQEIARLLSKYTCNACHSERNRQVGPSFLDISKRKYTPEKIVELIYNPKPENWPDYSSEMPPMPQVPKEEALKIAKWINSLQ